MAGDLNRASTTTPLPPAAAAYLNSIEGRVPRWRHARLAMMAELAGGLSDAIQHYLDLGLTCEQATTRAIGDSGPASVVACAISDALADGQARITAAALLVSGPLLGLMWLVTLVPGQWPSALLLHRPAIGVLVVTTAVFGGLTIMRGRVVRWWVLPRPAPTRSAAIACASAAICDICLLLSAASSMTSNASLGISGALAGTASLIRLALSQRVARRDLALNAPK